MAYEQIRYEAADGIATVTLHRPEKLNAVTSVMIGELMAAFDAADADDLVRAVIVTGAGRAFCAGADLSGGATTFDRALASSRVHSGLVSRLRRSTRRATPAESTQLSPRDDQGPPLRSNHGPRLSSKESDGATRGRTEPDSEHRDGGGLVTLRIFDMKKPVIAAINGPAVGFGATVTLAMDIRIASSAARMGFVFSRRGVVPEACSTWFLPRLVGIQQAAEWVYTGRVFDAEEACGGGLVSRVVPPEALMPTARALAREIADHTSAISVALARQMMWKLLGADHPMEAHRLDSRGMDWTGRSADAREGVSAFLEKRPARFPLRPSQDMPPFYPWWTERSFK